MPSSPLGVYKQYRVAYTEGIDTGISALTPSSHPNFFTYYCMTETFTFMDQQEVSISHTTSAGC